MPKGCRPPTSPVTAPDDLPSRVKALRRGVGLTAIQLDRLAGLGSGTVGRLERGHQKIYAAHLYRIAQAVGVNISWFYQGAETDNDLASGSERDSETQRLLSAYLRISDPGLQRDVFELVESLAKPSDD